MSQAKETKRSIADRLRIATVLRSQPARDCLIFIALLMLAVVMTWPWVLHLRDGVPDAGDTNSIAYFLWWDYHQTFHDPLNLFHATVFYPYKYSLAFGENDYGISLIFFPLFALGARPLTVYSVAAITSFAFSGYGMFRLARTLSGSGPAAWIAGVVFAFIPYRFHHLNHLHLLFAGWIPLTLEALTLFVRQQSWKRAGWLTLTLVMNALTCLTWFVLTLIPLAVSGVLLVARNRSRRSPAFWIRLGAAVLLASLLLLPFLLPYLYVARAHGFVRTPDEVQAYSALPINWLATVDNKLWQGLGAAGARPEMSLFPGFLPVLFAVAALLSAAKERWFAAPAPHLGLRPASELMMHGLLWTGIGFIGSFGLNFFFHRLLYEYLPVFRSMRVAARWAMICYVGLALLAGLGVKRFAELLKRRWPRPAIALTSAILLTTILFEQRAAPLSLIRSEPDPDKLTLYLKNKRMSGGIVELPAGHISKRYMLRAADHGHPLITGEESFTPPIAAEIDKLTSAQPIPDRFLDLLEQIPASYLTVHNALATPEQTLEIEKFLDLAIASGRLRFVRSFTSPARHGVLERNDLYAVTRTEPEAQSEELRPPPFLREASQPLLIANFEQTSFFVYRFYRASYARTPLFAEFMPDLQLLTRNPNATLSELEQNKRELVEVWVNRPEFKTRFDSLTDELYVDSLLAQSGIANNEALRRELLKRLGDRSMTRAAVLRRVVDDQAFAVQEFNGAFVVIHYFAYLRRDPETGGYYFWLDYLKRRPDYRNFTELFAASTERLDQPLP